MRFLESLQGPLSFRQIHRSLRKATTGALRRVGRTTGARDVLVSTHRHQAGEAATKAHAEVQKADQQLDALAKTYAARNGVTFEQAYDTIIQQPEGAALYAKYVEAQNRPI